jgi:hypothetical protein
LKGFYEKLKGQPRKTIHIVKREGKEKVTGAIKEIRYPQVPPKNKGVVKIIPMLL